MRPRNGSVLPEQPFKSSPNSTVSSIYNASTIDGNERLLSAANSINAPAAPTSLPLSVPVPVPVPSLSAFYSSPQSLRLNLQNCTDSPRPRRTSTDLTEPPPVFAYTDQTQRANQDVCGPDFHLTTLGCAVQGTQGIQPVKILIERLEAWQIFARRLYDHFEMLSQVEVAVGKTYQKMHGLASCTPQETTQQGPEKLEEKEHLLQVHFSFEGGIRQVCDAWQGYHDKRAKDHQAFGLFLQTQWLPSLAAIKREIKWMIRAVRADDRLTLSTLGRLKEEAEKRLDRLDRQLTFFNQHPDHGYNRQDPWLMNAAVVEQIIKLHRQENKFHETVLRLQQETLISEEQLIEEFRSLCQQLYAMQEKSELGIDRGFQMVMDTFEKVKMDGDWQDFAERAKDNLVSENAAFRRPDERLEYPNHTHPLLEPVFAARMERKSSVLHHWHEHIYVLTPAGFLHEYKSTKTYPEHPSTSIFVPHYNVSTISTHLLHHNLVFQLQPQSSGGASRKLFYPAPSSLSSVPREWGSASSSSPRSMLRPSSSKTITFRAKSAKDMQAWLEQLTACSHRFRPSVSYTAPPDLEPTRSLQLMNPSPAANGLTSTTKNGLNNTNGNSNKNDNSCSNLGTVKTDEKQIDSIVAATDKIQEAFASPVLTGLLDPAGLIVAEVKKTVKEEGQEEQGQEKKTVKEEGQEEQGQEKKSVSEEGQEEQDQEKKTVDSTTPVESEDNVTMMNVVLCGVLPPEDQHTH